MFECHITLDPRHIKGHERIMEVFAEKFNAKTSKIDGDPELGDKVWFYITFHRLTESDARTTLSDLSKRLQSCNIPIKREKIEQIIYDVRYA